MRSRLARVAVIAAGLVNVSTLPQILSREQSVLAEIQTQPPKSAVVADFDGDGLADRAVAVDDLFDVRLSVQLSTGRQAQIVQRLDRIWRLVGADFDGDGDVDLVAATEQGRLFVWVNNGTGLFVTASRRSPPATPAQPAFGANVSIAVALESESVPPAPGFGASNTTSPDLSSTFLSLPSRGFRQIDPVEPRGPRGPPFA